MRLSLLGRITRKTQKYCVLNFDFKFVGWKSEVIAIGTKTNMRTMLRTKESLYLSSEDPLLKKVFPLLLSELSEAKVVVH